MQQKHKLKNKQEIIIRPIKLSDSNARHQFFVKLSLAQIGIIHTQEEINYHTQESHDKIISFRQNKSGLWLIAKYKNIIIGEVDILIKNYLRIQHVGVLTIGIIPEFQNLGLGNLLMLTALNWAQNNNLTRIELSVFASNITAQNLYQKFGFNTEGTRKKYLKHPSGNFEDDILMSLEI